MRILLLAFLLITTGCMTESNTLEVTGQGAALAEERAKAEFDRPTVTNVAVVNNQLIIDGSKFHHVDKIRIKGEGYDDEFTIESKGKNRIVANSLRHLSFLVNASFELIMSNAYGSASYTVQFTLEDGAVTGKKIDRMLANDGEVLAWDATAEEWKPAALNSINLIGSWDPVTNTSPAIETGGYTFIAAPSHGDFHVVTQAHDFNPSDIDGVQVWAAGDWIFWDQTQNAGAGAWIRIQNTQQVTRVNSKSGDVTLNWADIPKTGSSIDDILDVDTTTAAPQSGEVLKWDGSKWAPATDDSQSFAGIVSTAVIANGTILNEDIDAAAAIDISKISGLTTGLADKLSLASGGTMAADIDMGSNNISNLGTVNGESIATIRTDITNLQNVYSGTTAQYVRGNGSLGTLNSDNTPEGSTNLYFSDARTRDAVLTGYVAGTDTALNAADTVMEAIAKLEGQVTQAKSDASGGGDLKSDGSVNMAANFNLGTNEITNAGGITSSGTIDSTQFMTANGLFGSNTILPVFQFELQNSAAGLTTAAGTISVTKGSTNVAGSGTSFFADYSANSFVYIHGVPYKISSVSSSTIMVLDQAIPFTDTALVHQKGKAAIAFFDSNEIPTLSFDSERGDLALGTYAATDEDSNRVRVQTISQTENDGTHNTNILDLSSRSYVENTNTNSGTQSAIKVEALRNDYLDGAPADSGTLTAQKTVSLTYGHENADVAATPATTTITGLELNPHMETGTVTTAYDIHIKDNVGAVVPTNNYGIVAEGTAKTHIIEGHVKIGDGADVPASALVVKGDVELTDGGVFRGDGSGLTGISTNGSTNDTDNTVIADNDDNGSGEIQFKIGSSPGTVFARLDNDGDFGIGVTTPTHKLEVEGNSLLDATNGDGVYFNLASGANLFGIQETATNDIVHFGVPSDDEKGLNFDVTTGAVGVGTTSPTGKFDVTDYLYDDGDCSDNDGYTSGDFDGDADAADCKKVGLVVSNDADVGIGTSSPSHLLDVAGHVNSENIKAFYASRTLTTTVNDTVEIGTFSGDASNILEIGIQVRDTTKKYEISLESNDGSKIIPAYQTNVGTVSSNDFDLIGNYSGTSLLLKLRRLGGTDTGAIIHIKSFTDNPFAASSTASTDASTSAVHQGTPIRITDNKVNVNNSVASFEAFALSVGNTYTGANFALTEGSTNNGWEFMIASSELKLGYHDDIDGVSAPSGEIVFATDGGLTANSFTGDGSSLTSVAATSATTTGNLVLTTDSDNNDANSEISFEDGSGTEIAILDSDGNFGINTDAPDIYTLSPNSGNRSAVISGSAANGSLILNNDTVPDITNGLSASSTAVAGIIDFMVEQNEGSSSGSGGIGRTIESGDSIAYIKSNLSGSGSTDSGSYVDGYGGSVSIWTKEESGSTTVRERLSIDHNGDVTIGSNAAKSDVEMAGTLCVFGDASCSVSPAAGQIAANTTLMTGADYAEYFYSEGRLQAGDLVGMNPNTGMVRYYQAGDTLMGIVSSNPGVIGNSPLQNEEGTTLVGLLGQLDFNEEQVVTKGREVYTKDGKRIGHIIKAGQVYINISSADDQQNREIASLKKKNADLEDRVQRLESLVEQLLNK